MKADRLPAGEYPGSEDEETALEKLGALLDCGVRTFIDLTESHELEPYDKLVDAEAIARGLAVAYHRMSIPDLSIPRAFRMRDILGAIKASLDRGDPVYVHCYGGIGRTGTVVGCWLIEQGAAGNDPIAAIAELRADIRKFRRPSPETKEQTTFVREWPGPRRKGGGERSK